MVEDGLSKTLEDSIVLEVSKRLGRIERTIDELTDLVSELKNVVRFYGGDGKERQTTGKGTRVPKT